MIICIYNTKYITINQQIELIKFCIQYDYYCPYARADYYTILDSWSNIQNIPIKYKNQYYWSMCQSIRTYVEMTKISITDNIQYLLGQCEELFNTYPESDIANQLLYYLTEMQI